MGEQKRLLNSRIGFVGLSTGSVTTETFLREGIGGVYLLADQDAYEMSNANRVLYGMSHEGKLKVDICADRIRSLDPHIEVQKYCQGITIGNAEAFVSSCDLIVLEDCDNLAIKFLIRQIARKLQVPVIMGMSQNGMIEIERYDIDTECRPYHISDEKVVLLTRLLAGGGDKEANLSIKENANLVSLFSKEQFSSRVPEVLQEISEGTRPLLPQLAKELSLNAVTLANTAKHILLGDDNVISGQFGMKMENLCMPQNRLFLSCATNKTMAVAAAAARTGRKATAA